MIKKTKTKQELAFEYAISRKTFTRRLKRHGLIIPRGVLLPVDIIQVYLTLGFPEQISDKERDYWRGEIQTRGSVPN